jgi:2-polyprenyl-3-methyl-5-hydroxy-6-metoxy-1,4-benzoquinol methylase
MGAGAEAFGEERLLRGVAEAALFRVLGVADPAHYLHYRYLHRALESLQREPTTILDAGSGPGDHALYLARRYPRAMVLGWDSRKDWVLNAARAARTLGIPNARFAVADLRDLRARERFDLVCAIDVLEHLPDPAAALRSFWAALRPGGAAFFHFPIARPRPVPFSRYLRSFHAWAETEHVAEPLTGAGFVTLVQEAGFSISRVTGTFGYFTGELATSLFNLPHRPTRLNRAIQGLLAPTCRLLALADLLHLDSPRYAIAVEARKPAPEP